MNGSMVAALGPGLYLIEWKKSQGGGQSLAAVGVTKDGGRWLAPVNWVSPSTDQHHWRNVARATFLQEVTPNMELTGNRAPEAEAE